MIREFLVKVEDWAMDDESTILGVTKILLIIGLLLGLVAAPFIYLDSQNPHIVLNKTEWHCSHEHTIMTPILVGKVVVPTQVPVCDTYTQDGY